MDKKVWARKSLEIQFWLKRRGMNQEDVAHAIGRHKSLVSNTIHGRQNSRTVMNYLKSLGVPKKYLGGE